MRKICYFFLGFMLFYFLRKKVHFEKRLHASLEYGNLKISLSMFLLVNELKSYCKLQDVEYNICTMNDSFNTDLLEFVK